MLVTKGVSISSQIPQYIHIFYRCVFLKQKSKMLQNLNFLSSSTRFKLSWILEPWDSSVHSSTGSAWPALFSPVRFFCIWSSSHPLVAPFIFGSSEIFDLIVCPKVSSWYTLKRAEFSLSLSHGSFQDLMKSNTQSSLYDATQYSISKLKTKPTTAKNMQYFSMFTTLKQSIFFFM